MAKKKVKQPSKKEAEPEETTTLDELENLDLGLDDDHSESTEANTKTTLEVETTEADAKAEVQEEVEAETAELETAPSTSSASTPPEKKPHPPAEVETDAVTVKAANGDHKQRWVGKMLLQRHQKKDWSLCVRYTSPSKDTLIVGLHPGEDDKTGYPAVAGFGTELVGAGASKEEAAKLAKAEASAERTQSIIDNMNACHDVDGRKEAYVALDIQCNEVTLSRSSKKEDWCIRMDDAGRLMQVPVALAPLARKNDWLLHVEGFGDVTTPKDGNGEKLATFLRDHSSKTLKLLVRRQTTPVVARGLPRDRTNFLMDVTSQVPNVENAKLATVRSISPVVERVKANLPQATSEIKDMSRGGVVLRKVQGKAIIEQVNLRGEPGVDHSFKYHHLLGAQVEGVSESVDGESVVRGAVPTFEAVLGALREIKKANKKKEEGSKAVAYHLRRDNLELELEVPEALTLDDRDAVVEEAWGVATNNPKEIKFAPPQLAHVLQRRDFVAAVDGQGGVSLSEKTLSDKKTVTVTTRRAFNFEERHRSPRSSRRSESKPEISTGKDRRSNEKRASSHHERRERREDRRSKDGNNSNNNQRASSAPVKLSKFVSGPQPSAPHIPINFEMRRKDGTEPWPIEFDDAGVHALRFQGPWTQVVFDNPKLEKYCNEGRTDAVQALLKTSTAFEFKQVKSLGDSSQFATKGKPTSLKQLLNGATCVRVLMATFRK